jgi:hypothetical protein
MQFWNSGCLPTTCHASATERRLRRGLKADIKRKYPRGWNCTRSARRCPTRTTASPSTRASRIGTACRS